MADSDIAGLIDASQAWAVVAAGPVAVLTLDVELSRGLLGLVASRDVVDVAVDKAGRRHRRDRALPAWVTVYLLFGLCLFAGEGYGSVLRQVWPALCRMRGRAVPVPDASAVPKARTRLGPQVLRAVFEEVAGAVAGPDTIGAYAFGRLLVAIDGTVLDVPDSADNDAAFDRAAGAGAPYPQVRLTMLFECATHAVIGATFAGTQVSEHLMADELCQHLRPGMLHLADRNFFSFGRWRAAARSGADLLWRVKAGTGKGIARFTHLQTLPDGSYLARIKETSVARAHREHLAGPRVLLDYHPDITVRVIEFTLTVHTGRGTTRTSRRETYRLITTILDHTEAPATALAALYHERWEAETGFAHLKTRLRGRRAVLRSHHPDGVYQELWAYLCLYQALCRIAATAAHTTGLDPDRISFTVTLRTLRRATSQPTCTCQPPPTPQTLLTEILHQPLPHRRNRTSTRGPKPPHRNPRTQPATHHITINPPPPAQTP